MASIATSTHLPALGAPVREEVGRELQATLVELVDLSLIGKQLHWSVVGPLFDPCTYSWTSSSTPGANWPTRSPSGRSRSASRPMGRRRR